MATKWLHLQLLGSDPWVLPVRNAINQAVQEGRMTEPGNEFNEPCLNVSLRLSLLPRIAIRINKAWVSLHEALNKREEHHEFTTSKEGYGFPWNQDSTLDLVIDLDSLLFEMWACAELMDRVLTRAYKDTQTPFRKSKGLRLDLTKGVLQRAGKNIVWIESLNNLRNHFIHSATLYPAVDLSQSGPELIVLRENVSLLQDDIKFVRLSELNSIIRGFEEAKYTLQEHLIQLFAKCKIAYANNPKDSSGARPDPRYVITDEAITD